MWVPMPVLKSFGTQSTQHSALSTCYASIYAWHHPAGRPGRGQRHPGGAAGQGLESAAYLERGFVSREYRKQQSELGKLAQTFIDRGELVPDDVTIAWCGQRLLNARLRALALSWMAFRARSRRATR